MRSTRRDALKAIGVTATVAGLVSVPVLKAKAATSPKRRDSKRAPIARTPTWLAELDGARFAGCLVHDVGVVKHGSVAITFSDAAGEFFVVDILRHDPETPGVAQAGSLAVYMRIDGQGKPTREEHGLAAMSLAAELSRREAAGLPAPALRTLNERAVDRRSA
jgi:hypothetical protein